MTCPGCGNSLWFVRTYCPFCKVNISAPARPRSVAVISWIYILGGGWILLALTVFSTPDSRRVLAEAWSQHPFATLWLCGVPPVGLFCGFFMLRGMNWARWVLVVWFGENVMAKVVFEPPKLAELSRAAKSLGKADSAQRVCEEAVRRWEQGGAPVQAALG